MVTVSDFHGILKCVIFKITTLSLDRKGALEERTLLLHVRF